MTPIHYRMLGLPLAALAFVALSAGSASAQVERTTPRPEVIRLAQAIVGAVNGNAEAVDKLVKEHFTSESQAAKPAADRRKWFESIRAKYGKVTARSLQRSEEDTFTIVASGEKNGEVRISVTHDENLKVKALGLEQGGGQ